MTGKNPRTFAPLPLAPPLARALALALAPLALTLAAGGTMAKAAPPKLTGPKLTGPKLAGPELAGPKLTAEDRLEIYELYSRFGYAVDHGKGDALAATMTEDGEFTGGRGPGRGREVRTPMKGTAAFQAMGDSTGNGTRHFYSNITLDPKPDGTVEGHAYMVMFMSRGSPPTIGETAVYDDVLVKTPQGWKFRKRTVWRDDDDITPYKFKPLPPDGKFPMPAGAAPPSVPPAGK